MEVPSFLVGDRASVKPRARRAARAIIKGASIGDIERPLVDSSLVPGFFLVNGPSRSITGEHFQAFTLTRALSAEGLALEDDRWGPIVKQLAERTWGLVALVTAGPDAYLGAAKISVKVAFLRSVARAWPVLTSVSRYSAGTYEGQPFEKVASMVAGVLYSLGDQPPIADKFGREVPTPPIHGRILRMLESLGQA